MRSRVHEAEPKSLYATQDLQTFRGLTPFAEQPVQVIHPAVGNFCVESGHL